MKVEFYWVFLLYTHIILASRGLYLCGLMIWNLKFLTWCRIGWGSALHFGIHFVGQVAIHLVQLRRCGLGKMALIPWLWQREEVYDYAAIICVLNFIVLCSIEFVNLMFLHLDWLFSEGKLWVHREAWGGQVVLPRSGHCSRG